MVDVSSERVVSLKPCFASVRKLFIKGHIDDFHVRIIDKFEIDLVRGKLREVFLGFLSSRSSKTLIVLRLQVFCVYLSVHPCLVLRNREEGSDASSAFMDLDNGRDKLDQESI